MYCFSIFLHVRQPRALRIERNKDWIFFCQIKVDTNIFNPYQTKKNCTLKNRTKDFTFKL